LVEDYFYPKNESLKLPSSPKATNLLHAAHVSFKPDERSVSDMYETDRRGLSMGEEMDIKSALSFNRNILKSRHLKTEVGQRVEDIRL